MAFEIPKMDDTLMKLAEVELAKQQAIRAEREANIKTPDILMELLREQKRTNDLLEKQVELLMKQTKLLEQQQNRDGLTQDDKGSGFGNMDMFK